MVTRGIILCLFVHCVAFTIIFGQPDALPPGVSWINAAEGPEIESSPIAVLLVREPIGEGNFSYVASVWEIRLDPEPAIYPRVRFVESHWSPDFLVGRGQGRSDLVRLQVPRMNGYRVNLYSIDYLTWRVNTVWQGEQAVLAFIHDNDAYIDVNVVLTLKPGPA
jgi:hypothetical protein